MNILKYSIQDIQEIFGSYIVKSLTWQSEYGVTNLILEDKNIEAEIHHNVLNL